MTAKVIHLRTVATGVVLTAAAASVPVRSVVHAAMVLDTSPSAQSIEVVVTPETNQPQAESTEGANSPANSSDDKKGCPSVESIRVDIQYALDAVTRFDNSRAGQILWNLLDRLDRCK